MKIYKTFFLKEERQIFTFMSFKGCHNGSKRQKALESLRNTSALTISVMVFLPSVGSYSQMKRLVRSLTTNAEERKIETKVNMFSSIAACNQLEYGITIKKSRADGERSQHAGHLNYRSHIAQAVRGFERD